MEIKAVLKGQLVYKMKNIITKMLNIVLCLERGERGERNVAILVLARNSRNSPFEPWRSRACSFGNIVGNNY